MSNLYGIWIGKDATVAIIKDFCIAFLRIENNLIASVLKHNDYGTIGVVYGVGTNFDAHSVMSAKNPETKLIFNNSNEAENNLVNHSNDKLLYDGDNKKLIYKMYNGTDFDLILAEQINMDDFEKINAIDNTLPLEKRMALWCVRKNFEYSDGYLEMELDTQKYSICFYVDIKQGYTYCRVGQNGFCEKGRAMLSTICIRHNECRMIENNLLSTNEYKPIEECFVADGCAFPSDGGWYWSIKEVTDDIIYLHGCSGAIYEIRRLSA